MKNVSKVAVAVSLIVSPLVSTVAQAAGPSISSVSPGTATVGVPVTLTASVSDAQGIQSCNLYVDNDDKGAMSVSGGQASKSFTFTAAQIYTVFVFCRNNAGGFNSGPNTAVWAKAGGGGDVTAPIVGAITPLSAVAGQAVTLSATYSDSVTGVQSCNLFVGGADKGAMSLSGSVASLSYAFNSAGNTTVYAKCVDGAGNAGFGPNAVIAVAVAQVSAPAPDPTPEPTPPPVNPSSGLKPGSLIKLTCPEGAEATHPCKAVYYYGSDGKRHAFPNEKVYFTWYQNFDGVVTVIESAMAGIALGKNVAYRPGSRMVKFTTLNNVYAVGKGSVLRWVKTEEVAKSLYGAEWNKAIDDIADTYYLDYTFGQDINNPADFSPAGESGAVPTIDLNL